MVDWVILFGKIMFSKPNLLWSSVKGAWLVRLFCKSCRIYYRVGINRTKNNILPENIFLSSMWFKKCIFVKKAGLCATRFQRFVGKVLLCKLVANTFWEPKNGIAYLRVLEISQNIVLKRNTWLPNYFKSFHRQTTILIYLPYYRASGIMHRCKIA